MTRHSAYSMTVLASAIALAATAAFAGLEPAKAEETASITFRISGFAGTEGELAVALYPDASGWLGQSPVAAARVAIDGDVVEVLVDGLAPGTYAAVAYHDVNANGRLDTGAMRMPTEPFGYSAGAQARFGPARFDAAAITVAAGEARVDTITLRGAMGQ